MFLDSIPGFDPFAGTRIYNEAAFHRFLEADWARAERLRRCVLLILVSMQHQATGFAALPKAAVTSVFRGLVASARDEDFVGWFREGRVAAASLVRGPGPLDASADVSIGSSVRRAIEAQLPPVLAGALRVRVRRLGISHQQ
jgi:hypothetical protein